MFERKFVPFDRPWQPIRLRPKIELYDMANKKKTGKA